MPTVMAPCLPPLEATITAAPDLKITPRPTLQPVLLAHLLQCHKNVMLLFLSAARLRITAWSTLFRDGGADDSLVM